MLFINSLASWTDSQVDAYFKITAQASPLEDYSSNVQGPLPPNLPTCCSAAYKVKRSNLSQHRVFFDKGMSTLKEQGWEGGQLPEEIPFQNCVHEMVGWHHWLTGREFEQKLQVMVKDREAWHASVHGVTKRHNWVIEQHKSYKKFWEGKNNL